MDIQSNDQKRTKIFRTIEEKLKLVAEFDKARSAGMSTSDAVAALGGLTTGQLYVWKAKYQKRKHQRHAKRIAGKLPDTTITKHDTHKFGWECPKCFACLAPWVLRCTHDKG